MEKKLEAADKAASKHAEKLQAREAARLAKEKAAVAAGKSAEPVKYVKKLVATRDKLRERKERKLAEQRENDDDDDDEPEQQLMISRDDGTSCDYSKAAEDILTFLKDHGSEATLEEVHRGVGIDLRQLNLLEALRNNPRIEAVALATGERLKYRPPFGVYNRGALAHLLSRTAPGSGETEAVLRSELKEEQTYAGLDVDIDELLAQGRAVRVSLSDQKKSRDYVLFGAAPGRPASAEVRTMWSNERVPKDDAELEKYLLKHNLRTSEQILQRKKRIADANARKAELDALPKKRAGGQIRKWANTHLGDIDYLEATFANPTK